MGLNLKLFSQCLHYKETDQFPLERGLENKLLLKLVGIFKAKVNEQCLLDCTAADYCTFQQRADVSIDGTYFIITNFIRIISSVTFI